jgi:hypothetical protein
MRDAILRVFIHLFTRDLFYTNEWTDLPQILAYTVLTSPSRTEGAKREPNLLKTTPSPSTNTDAKYGKKQIYLSQLTVDKVANLKSDSQNVQGKREAQREFCGIINKGKNLLTVLSRLMLGTGYPSIGTSKMYKGNGKRKERLEV